jgi:cytochrome P450
MTSDRELSSRAGPAHCADWVRLDDLYADPYPVYARLREEAPVAWVPAANRYLVTRYADVHQVDNDPETFSADESGSLMKRVMGHTLLRKDGAAHARERKAAGTSLRPKAVKQIWTPLFQRNAEHLIAEMRDAGEAELVSRFAAPYAAANLRDIIGLPGASPADLVTWSQAMMDGTGNYADDPAVWARSEAAARAVDDALAEAIPRLRAHPDDSMISAMLHAEDPLSPEEISAYV